MASQTHLELLGGKRVDDGAELVQASKSQQNMFSLQALCLKKWMRGIGHETAATLSEKRMLGSHLRSE